MLAVKFYEDVKDELLRFAVVIAKHDGKWVLCKHKKRETLEFPGGHRETGEAIAETAKRELMEETGAVKFEIRPICVYSVTGKTRVNETGEEAFGGLFYAEIASFGEIHSEMEKIVLCDAAGKLDVPGNSAGTFERGGKTGVRRINGHKESTQSMKICVLFVCIVLT